MGEPATDHQLAKILVVGDEDAPLGTGDREDPFVGNPGRVVTSDSGSIVAAVGEERRDPRLGAFVEEEPHDPGD